MQRLRNHATLERIPMVCLPSSLSRSSIIIEAIGPVWEFKVLTDDNGPQPVHLAGDITTDWRPIERFVVKNPPAPKGIVKTLLFIGAIKNFRSDKGKKDRFHRALDKGYCQIGAGIEEEDRSVDSNDI